MMYLGNQAVGIAVRKGIHEQMNHLESGSFTLESGASTSLSLSNIDLPKGVLIFSNAFDLSSPKADKPMLGTYMATYVAGTDTLSLRDNVYYLSDFSMYAVNWGQSTDDKNPVWRSTRTENRGIRWFNPSNKSITVTGFGTGEYDFKYNVQYNWIAWD